MRFCALPQRTLSTRRPCLRREGVGEAPSRDAVLLDRFWKSRGVVDSAQRRRLIDAAQDPPRRRPSGDIDVRSGLVYVWNLDALQPEISESLLTLRDVLGEDVDVVWMCRQEPSLLSVSSTELLRRVLAMKLSLSGDVADVVAMLERQPRLLLSPAAAVDKTESPTEQLPAWEHGLVTDQDAAWGRHYVQLAAFFRMHGHSHVGFADADAEELTAWVQKQRDDFHRGTLLETRRLELTTLEFEFDAVEAEWLYWFHLWRDAERGVAAPTSSAQLRLLHWCSVQRIAEKSDQLSTVRKQRLDSNAFNWRVPEPLS